MSQKSRILVTPRSLSRGHWILDALKEAGYEPVTPSPGETPSEVELVESIGECVGYLAGVEPVTEKVLSSARNLKAISRNGVGVDNIDLKAAEEHGIRVLTADGANAQGVAELTVGLLFCGLRQVVKSDRTLKSHQWQRSKGRETSGTTLGVVGLGRIGANVVQYSSQLGMDVIGYDPYVDEATAKQLGCEPVDFQQVLERADVLTLHCPMRSNGTPVVGKDELQQCFRGVFIINTARAGLVDLTAMLEALDSGHVSLYATDVFPEEPPADWTLVDHPSVIATPHIGGYTTESVDRAARMAMENLRQAIEGETGEVR